MCDSSRGGILNWAQLFQRTRRELELPSTSHAPFICTYPPRMRRGWSSRTPCGACPTNSQAEFKCAEARNATAPPFPAPDTHAGTAPRMPSLLTAAVACALLALGALADSFPTPVAPCNNTRLAICDPPPIREYQTFDGWYHNLAEPEWGVADRHFFRISQPEYYDGVYEPSGFDRPNARDISEAVMAGKSGEASIMNRTALLVFFGQQVRARSMSQACADGRRRWWRRFSTASARRASPSTSTSMSTRRTRCTAACTTSTSRCHARASTSARATPPATCASSSTRSRPGLTAR